MAQTITDLSDLLKEPRKVRFEPNGPLYVLPGDLPAELYLRIQIAESAEITADYVKVLADQVLELFRVHQPDLDELPCSLAQMVALIPRVYNDEEPEDPPKPPARQRASNKPSTTPAKTSARKPRRSASST